MDDRERPPDGDHRPHLTIERQLTVGPHAYQLTASDVGDGRIGLRLVGWNAAGEVVGEISGGMSPADLAPLADALTSTLAGLAALRRQRLTATAPPPAPPRRHRNQGVRWSAEDDERLAARHRAGASPRELMAEFGRSRGGITARLERLGLITPESGPATVGDMIAPEGGPATVGDTITAGADGGGAARAPATAGEPVALGAAA